MELGEGSEREGGGADVVFLSYFEWSYPEKEILNRVLFLNS